MIATVLKQENFTEEVEEPPSKRAPYGAVKDDDWNSWKWQMANRIQSFFDLEKLNIRGLKKEDFKFPLSITPYYATHLYNKSIDYPLCKTMIPSADEMVKSAGEADDPLSEDEMSPVPSIVHRYPDRVLFLTTETCASYCRYCTRSRRVGNECKKIDTIHGDQMLDTIALSEGLEYIRTHSEVRDVLVSGGDPLTLPTSKLFSILSELRSINHVEIIRLGTKVPVVLPQRITEDLCNVLKQFHPLYINIHFTHPDELTPETIRACEMLADAGIPLGSQTVLLKGVNDDVETLKKLFLGLVKVRVKPYYLYSMDRIIGSSHFAVSVEKGIDIINKLTGNITGFAIPKFVIDAPKGGGKIPINSDNIIDKENGMYKLKNYQGKIYEYPIE
jgi:lysine 2,3-aminomutase